MKLSIVVPCYNEEENVKPFYDEVYKVFSGKKIEYEIIFVNDGSKDNTIKELEKLIDNKKQNIKVVNFSRNFGKEAAMYAGLKESSGDFVSIIDADLQQNPNIILKMIDILNDNPDYDCVAAYQESRKEGKVLSSFKKCFYKIINSISTVEFINGASDFRTFRRSMVDSIVEISEYNRFSKGIFSFVGFNTYYLPYKVEERRNGSSKWSFWKLFNYAIEGIVGFSNFPLKVPFILGIISFIVGIVFTILFIITGFSYIKGLYILIPILFSLVFFSLGIIGEYLSRTYLETKRRPVYIAKSIKSSNKNKS